MANYNNLKTAISEVIKTNGNEEITGALLQQSLLAMINELGAGYQFVGIAQPDTLPGAVDYRCFYIAAKAGTYSHFNDIEVEDGELALLVWGTDWTKQSIALGVADGAVSAAKLADDSVTTSKIVDGAVNETKIADGSITGDKFSPGLTLYMNKQFSYLKQVQVKYGEDPSTAIKSFAQRDNKTALYIKLTNGLLVPANTNGETASGLYSYGNTIRKVLFDGTNWSDTEIQSDIIDTAHIKDGSVTTNKIADRAVTEPKLSKDLQGKVNDNVKYVEQNLTKEQQLQARKNIELPDYETFDDLTQLSSLTAKRLLYVGADNTTYSSPISVNSSIEEIDFQGKTINFGGYNAEQIAFKGHPNCKIKNLSCILTKVDYQKDANVCISKFGYVENVIVNCSAYSSAVEQYVNKSLGFLSCDHLYNCKVIGGGVIGEMGVTWGYRYCNYLNLCRYKISGEAVGAKGFDHCQFISQCYVNRQLEEIMGLGTNSNVESLIWILANGSFETFSDIDHITVGGYDTTNMFKTIGSVGGTGKTKLYAKPDDKSGIATVLLDTTPVNWAVARRTLTGTLKAKDAVEEDDTVTKKQLDAVKAKITPILQEINLVGTDADRKAKLDKFETDWKALTGASDLTGARFVGVYLYDENNVDAIFMYDPENLAWAGIAPQTRSSETLTKVYVNPTDGAITITPLFSHLEAITIYTDNTTEHMQANLDNIAAYEANLQALGVDTTAGITGGGSPIIPITTYGTSLIGYVQRTPDNHRNGFAINTDGTSCYEISVRGDGYYQQFVLAYQTSVDAKVDKSPNAKSLEAITIKIGNTPDDKAANLTAIKEYVDNLKLLSIDVTKGYMIPVKLHNGYHGFIMGTDTDGEYTGVIKRAKYNYGGGWIQITTNGTYQYLETLTTGSYSLTTTSKKIVDAINEVNTLAKGVKAFGAIELKASDNDSNKAAITAYLKILTDAGVSTTNGYSVPVRITGNSQEYHGMLNIGTGVLLSGVVTDVNENHHYPFNVSTTDGAILFDENNYFLEKTSDEVTEMLDAIKYSYTSVPFTDTTLSNKAQLEVFLSKVPAATVMHCTYNEIWAGTLHKINGDWYGLLVKNTNSPADNINVKLSADGTIIKSNSAQ